MFSRWIWRKSWKLPPPQNTLSIFSPARSLFVEISKLFLIQMWTYDPAFSPKSSDGYFSTLFEFVHSLTINTIYICIFSKNNSSIIRKPIESFNLRIYSAEEHVQKMSWINPVVFNLKERKMGKTSIKIDLRGLLIKHWEKSEWTWWRRRWRASSRKKRKVGHFILVV